MAIRIIQCVGCGEPKPFHAKGMCRACYSRVWRTRHTGPIGKCVDCKEIKSLHCKQLCQICYWRKARKTDLTWRTRHRKTEYKTKLKRFGLTLEDYAILLEKQGGRCACCSAKDSGPGHNGISKPLSVDHCHLTGKVRGLLCRNCNTSLGNVRDDPERLERLAAYLRASKMEANALPAKGLQS